MNLLKETLRELNANGKTPEDVKWCGSETFGWFTWDEFATLADREYEYDGQIDSGYPKIPTDLKIVGENWWLERYTCNGIEWWDLKRMPSKPDTHRVPATLVNEISRSGESLATLHEAMINYLQENE